MKASEKNMGVAIGLVASMTQLDGYPFPEEGRQELARALIDGFDRIEDAKNYVRNILDNERTCPKVVDVLAYRRLTAAAKIERQARDCPLCKGLGWRYEYYLRTHFRNPAPGEKRQTTERITEQQAAELNKKMRMEWEAHNQAHEKWKQFSRCLPKKEQEAVEAPVMPMPPNQEVVQAIRRCSCIAAT